MTTVTVTMLQTRRGENGALWTAGSSYAASEAFAAVLISSNLATGSLPAVPTSSLTIEQVLSVARANGQGFKCSGLLLDGDSFSAKNWQELSISAAAQAAGVATVTASGFLPVVGSRIKIGNYTDPRWNGFFTVLSATGATATFAIDPAADVAPSVGTRSQAVVTCAVQRGSQGDYVWAEMVNGVNYTLIDDVAYGGRKLTEILADAPFTIGQYRNCLIDLCAGTNDPRTSVATATSSAAIEAYIVYAQSLGHTVLLNTVPPLYGAANTATVAQLTAALNKEIKRLALAYRLPLYDKFAALVDPATAALLVGNVDTSDNIHVAPAAAKIAGAAKAAIYAAFVPTRPVNLPATTQDLLSLNTSSQNIFDGFFAGTGGTGTGAVATGWTLAGTLATTGSKGSGSVGATQIVTAPADGAASGKTVTLTSTSVHASVVAGGRYEFVGKLSWANWTAGLRCTLSLDATVDGYAGSVRALTTSNSTTPLPPAGTTIKFRSEPFTVPAGAAVTVFRPALTLVATGATGGTETVTLESWAINRLD